VTEYILLVLLQILVLPEIEAGCIGAAGDTDTETAWPALVPHALMAATVIFPPAVPVCVLITFVAEDPVHPFGRVQV
jgi:hypothetical protein